MRSRFTAASVRSLRFLLERTGPRNTRALRATGAALGLLLCSSSAGASPEYPQVIRDQLGMPCAPQCTLCHTSNPGRSGNVRQEFAGLLGVARAGEPGRVREKLLELQQEHPEVVDALLDGRDPNVAGSEEGDICATDVRYGCGARVEPGSPLAGPGWLLVLLAALGIGLRVRRRTASAL
jgi:MYXO-CTERM domain-containing protein